MATPQSFSYIKTDGSTGYTNDQKVAPGIAAHSGFQTVVASPPAGGTVAPPVNSIPAPALGSNPSTYSTYFPTPSAHTNLAESAIASKDAYLANSAKEADALKAEQATGKKTIADAFTQLSGQSKKKADLYESGGINTDKKAIDELTSQIESRTRAYDKQIQDIQMNNPEGKLASGVQNEVNRVSQQKASELADLAIVLNAKTRNYDTAKGIIDTKVDAETEDLRNKLTGLQFFYNENASNLSEDKKILLNDKITQAQNELDDKKQLRKDIGILQLDAAKNGAPVSIVRAIGAATDITNATAAAGGYLKTPKVGTGPGTFTTSQINDGAANAGIPISQFNTLSADDKNYFVNGYSSFTAALKQVQNGDATEDDLRSAIEATTLTPAGKAILYKRAGISATGAAKSGGVGGFFSSAMQFVGNLFGA